VLFRASWILVSTAIACLRSYILVRSVIQHLVRILFLQVFFGNRALWPEATIVICPTRNMPSDYFPRSSKASFRISFILFHLLCKLSPIISLILCARYSKHESNFCRFLGELETLPDHIRCWIYNQCCSNSSPTIKPNPVVLVVL